MDTRTTLSDEFERHRPYLRAVAYRMLGSVTEADDAVQESWLRLDRNPPEAGNGTASGVAAGVPLTIRLLIQDQANSCGPVANAAVYLWHCDQEGRYSLYSDGVTSENYLRGVQGAGTDGVVTLQSIFPACYSGRWPHIHFEVYRSLAEATDQGNKVATSQIALPQDACDAVYATSGYQQSVTNLQQVSLATDNVFGEDGGERQIGTVTGSVDAGYSVELAVPVNAA